LLGDLAAALGELEKTIEATRAGRRDHPSLRSGQVVGASADLNAVAAEIHRASLFDQPLTPARNTSAGWEER